MFLKRLAALTAVLAIGVAACSGASTNVPDPLVHGTGLSSTGGTVPASGVSGITASITVTGSGDVNAQESSTQPATVPALQSVVRATSATTQSVKTAATTPNTPLVYVTITASAAATISGFPASTFTFATAPTGSLYLAYYNGTQWVTIAGPGTVSGDTVTFGATTFSPSIPLAINASIYLAVYSGAVLATPTPTPSASASASASPSASPTPTHSPTASPSPSGSPTASASPSPSGSPTATPSGGASPTPTPSPTATATVQAIVNGNFETGSMSPWYPCFASHSGSAPVDDNLTIPANEDPTPIPSFSPTPAASSSPDLNGIVISTSVPATGGTTAPVHGGTYAGLVGHPYGLPSPTALKPWRGKGDSGFCQDITVPAFHPMLTMWVFEGGNDSSLYINDVEADLYAMGSFATAHGAMETTAAPASILFLEDNCFDAVPFPVSFSPPSGDCTAPSGVAVQGGVWKQKGPYDLTALAGTSVTLFMGIMGSSTSATYYGYAYFDDVSLTGTTTASKARGTPQLFNRFR